MNPTKEINKNILLAATMATHFFNPFMGSAVNIALKKIGTEFAMSAVQLSWVSMAYLLAMVVFLVPFGRLADLWGKTKMFLYGTLLFGAITFICAFVNSSSFLIAMRFAQGVAAAMMSGTLMALVISAFPPEQRGKVIGLNVSSVYMGSSLAPMIGGFLIDTLTWRSLFLINGSVSLLIGLVIILKLNKEWAGVTRAKFDFKGSIIYMASISMFMYGLSKLPEIHAIIFTSAGLVGLLIFIRVELNTDSPVLNIRLFTHNRMFALSNLSALINYAATFAVSFMLSLYLQYALGFEASGAGLILMMQPVLMAIVASFSGRLSDRKNPRKLAALGMGINAVGIFMLSFLGRDTSTIYILASLFVLGIGFGMFSSPNTNVVMGSVDRKIYGTASATLATMRNTGMMVSMAIASLTLHLFLGQAQINDTNTGQFINSTNWVFGIFTVLCLLGVYTSLARNRRPGTVTD